MENSFDKPSQTGHICAGLSTCDVRPIGVWEICRVGREAPR